MKEIITSLKDFREAVEAIWLRGKYKSSTVSKTDVISNSAVAIIKDRRIEVLNGNDKSALSVSIPILNDESQIEFMFIFDIEKLMKYLKNLKEDRVSLLISDSHLTIKNGKTSIRLPKLLEHSNMNLISMIRTFAVKPDTPIIFGKTELECTLVVDGEELAKAIKFCNLVGTATFRINYIANENSMTISSSNSHRTELVDRDIDLMVGSTKDVTVEFSAPIDKFCISGPMVIYSGDNKPVIITAPYRKMVVAPYIRVD
jgi:hypothetical protein